MGGGGGLQSYCPYLDDLSQGVGPFTGETTAGQINGADGSLVLYSLTKHYKGKKNPRSRTKTMMYCKVIF